MPVRDFLVGGLTRTAEAWLDGTGGEPVQPRDAATVMLVRDGPAGVEVFMLRRVASMAFAPSTMVFPGGSVDPRDGDPGLPWAGHEVAEWARILGVDEVLARELVAAAVRELFEECGVLLAGRSAHDVVEDVSGPHWQAERAALLARECSLREVLVSHDLVLRSDLLSPRAHWLTPEFEPRRYDTRFFAARMPVGQVADDLTTEADLAEWTVPARLLADHANGLAQLLPPTLVSLEQLAKARNAAELLQQRRPLVRVHPVPARTSAGVVMRCELPG